MSDIPVEKKMELVHQIRSQYQKNQYDLMNRESILYGRPASGALHSENHNYKPDYFDDTPSDAGIFRDGTIKIRYALAVVLLLTIIILDITNKSIAGVNMEQLYNIIESDYGDTMAAWFSTDEKAPED